jgi:L-aspartate oxidase
MPAPPVADAATRAALWRDAGIVRSREGLGRLLQDSHPLARLIARSALAREESRGAHMRSDFPERNPALDHRHVVIGADEQIAWEKWD